jgi:GNAT superfamily N-acetyltransferase
MTTSLKPVTSPITPPIPLPRSPSERCGSEASCWGGLTDGSLVLLRPLGDGERAPVQEVFAGMSPASRYLRYLTPMKELSQAMVERLTTLDGQDRVAWGAFREGRCIAVVRYVHLVERPGTADVAVEVVDHMHRRGVGRLLLGVLASVAETNGVTTFALTVHPENAGSLGLTRSLSARFRFVDGLYEGQLSVAAVLDDSRVRHQIDVAFSKQPASWEPVSQSPTEGLARARVTGGAGGPRPGTRW